MYAWCYKDGHWTGQGIKKLEARDNESGRNVPESLEKKVEVVRTCHAMRKDDEFVGERVMRVDVEGRRRRGRSKLSSKKL